MAPLSLPYRVTCIGVLDVKVYAMTDRKDVLCQKCSLEKVCAMCLGCGISVCETCARFELIGSGCGCVWPAYYCYTCAFDPVINPNASFREPESNPGIR